MPQTHHTLSNSNRLELLLFSLGGKQRFTMNVLKVREIIPCPTLHILPSSNPNILGIANLRGENLSIIDLGKSISLVKRERTAEEIQQGTIIVADINRKSLAFWIKKVDKIIIKEWKDILPPSGHTSLYVTGITFYQEKMLQVIDVERVLADIFEIEEEPDFHFDELMLEAIKGQLIFVVDDSSMARKQTSRALEKLNLKVLTAEDGKIALQMLKDYANGNPHTPENIAFIITDIEMPEMDGYTLVEEVRKLPYYENMYILMHTSLNGSINADKAKAAGANKILTKFVPALFAEIIVKELASKA